MIIGRNFAIGHIPKTGGDAIHTWVRAMNDEYLIVDDVAPGQGKHDTFVYRPETRGKQFYVLGIARLPIWTLSLMHEDSRKTGPAADWGHQRPEDMRLPSGAFRQPYGDWHLARMRQGVQITHWLRSGPQLLDDLIACLCDVYRQLRQDEIDRMRQVAVKPPRSYDHDLRATWTREERETLYRLNPQWAAIEALAYGDMW